MAAHVSTKQIIAHIQSAAAVSVEGEIFKNITVDDKNLIVGTYVFPLDYFDIGGMNRESIALVDQDGVVRHIMMLGEDGLRVEHPQWDHEPYDSSRVRNRHVSG